MKIALIIPEFLSGSSFLQPPLCFLYTSALLRNNNYQVTIIDLRVLHININVLVSNLADYDLIVVTTTPYDQVQNYFLDYRLSNAFLTINSIKKKFPKIPLVVCGSHSTVHPALLFEDVNADALLQGEIPNVILNIANCIKEKEPLANVPNLVFKNGKEIEFSKRDNTLWHTSLSDDLFPDYDNVDMTKYYGVKYYDNVPVRQPNRGVIMASKGCPYQCNFCHNFFGTRVCQRSADSVIEEIVLLKEKHNVKEVFFLDSTFTLNKKWVTEFCQKISQNNLKLDFTIQTRIDLLDSEILECLSEANIKNIWFGIESFDQHILDLSNKQYSANIIVPTIYELKEKSFIPNIFFMLGMPGETIDTLNNTIKNIHELKIPYTRSIMICTPRYGTKLYEKAKKQYPNIDNHWFYLNAVKGLIDNSMSVELLSNAKDLLKTRDFIFKNELIKLK